MNKDFFQNLEQRAKDFESRGQLAGSIRTEVVLVNGRSVVVDKVVDAGDDVVQFDGHDVVDEETPVSIACPYHQISMILFTKTRPRSRQAGFSAS